MLHTNHRINQNFLLFSHVKCNSVFLKLETYPREFPGGIVVRIPGFHCHGPGSVPGWGTGDPASYVAQPKKKRTYPQNFPSAAASSPTSGPGARTVLLSCCLAPHCCFQSWLSQFTGLWKFMDVHGVHGTTLSSSSTLFSSFRAGSATLSEPASPFERITLPQVPQLI